MVIIPGINESTLACSVPYTYRLYHETSLFSASASVTVQVACSTRTVSYRSTVSNCRPRATAIGCTCAQARGSATHVARGIVRYTACALAVTDSGAMCIMATTHTHLLFSNSRGPQNDLGSSVHADACTDFRDGIPLLKRGGGYPSRSPDQTNTQQTVHRQGAHRTSRITKKAPRNIAVKITRRAKKIHSFHSCTACQRKLKSGFHSA